MLNDVTEKMASFQNCNVTGWEKLLGKQSGITNNITGYSVNKLQNTVCNGPNKLFTKDEIWYLILVLYWLFHHMYSGWRDRKH